MEQDNELKGDGNSYTTLFRQYDPRVGRWMSTDPLESYFPHQSPYVGLDNNPIYYVDTEGDSAWVTTKGDTATLHITGKVINMTGEDIDMEEAINDIKEDFIDTYSGSYTDENGNEMTLAVDIQLENANSLSEVDASDHLIVFSNVEHKEGNARGAANTFGGKIAYVSGQDYPSNSSWFGMSLTNTAIHEFGHLLGLEHTDDFNNLMRVGASGYMISSDQRRQIVQNASNGRLNKGLPYTFMYGTRIKQFDLSLWHYNKYVGTIKDVGHSLRK
jgi:RHS repeat-associated protein